MKRLLLLLILMISVTLVKAQFTTVNVINNSGRTNLYLILIGNNGTGTPCSPTSATPNMGPLAPSTMYTYTPTTAPFSPALPPTGSTIVAMKLTIMPPGLLENGPVYPLCTSTLPASGTALYNFSGGSSNNLVFTSSGSGVITVTINP